ncbi:nuclear transport factor 2 family protein [Tunturiibacter empetritectus]|uniref:DUF4440 domain-containing protein n=1 Tax=Tunturiibacter lichenicola TaxID=2051959 RepID=A0A852V9U9_9BACT|nr:nuclear transport factor 2 family protein [Edaphobacter lichenicola]NYF89673.1 hypothetical protein [Edaphobacter lichenicola]
MRRFVLLSLLLVSSVPAIAQPGVVSEIKGREEEFRQAELHYDMVAAAQILADDFVLISASDGKPHDKNWFLPIIGDSSDPMEALDYGDMDVRIYRTSAVVVSTVHEKFLFHGKPVEYSGPRNRGLGQDKATMETCRHPRFSNFLKS